MSLLNDLNNHENEEKRSKIIQNANEDFDRIYNEEVEKKATESALQAMSDNRIERIVKMKDFAKRRILELEDDVTPERIERVCNRILNTEDGKKCLKDNNESGFARLVNRSLKKEQDKSKISKDVNAAPSSKAILSFLEDDLKDATATKKH